MTYSMHATPPTPTLCPRASVVISVPELCIFCLIVTGKAERSVVAEDAQTLAFMNLFQRTGMEGHVLVVPKRHVQDIYALDADTAGAVYAMAVRVARAVRQAVAPDGITIIQNNEPAGGQDVFHLHMHVIPRRNGDGGPYTSRHQPPRAVLDSMAACIGAAMETG
jgi:histidine triad (HIT) family protein